MLQSQLVLGVISFLSIGRDCFWRAHKLADGFSVTRFETPSLLVKRFVVLSLYEQNVWEVTHVSRKSTRMWLAIGGRGLESLHLLLPFLGLFPSASGGRGGCVWEQRRMQTGRGSLTSWEFVFTRHRERCPLRVWFELHQACRPRLASEFKLTDGAETSRSRLTADAAKRLL